MTDSKQEFDQVSFLAHLKKRGVLKESVLRRASSAADQTQTSVERAILELGLLNEDLVYQELAMFLGLAFITVEMIDFDLLQSGLLQSGFMKRTASIPVKDGEGGLLIATSEPSMNDLLASLRYLLEVKVEGSIATPTTIASVLSQLEQPQTEAALSANESDIDKLQALANDGPIISLVNEIVSKAVGIGASDVHIEAHETGAKVRFRVDGVMQVDRTLSTAIRETVTSRLKIMANLNISEKRRPQDGRTEIVVRGHSIDIRMSTLPTQFGESIVLRLLDQSRVKLDWAHLQFSKDKIHQIRRLINAPNGIFLVAGPTGSGKTTTLYTALSEINSDERKILTVEDPIEYSLPGINQVQVDTAIDLSFASALRAILRQDPNVIMIGEIRDEVTAEIAVRAALVGRLVLSTIHTNDAISAVDRLLDLGIPPYLISATLRGVLSQRLVRSNCPSCQGKGCNACNGTGHLGRMAVSEICCINEQTSEAIAAGKRGSELKELAVTSGFEPMLEEVNRLVREGRLSRREVEIALGFNQ